MKKFNHEERNLQYVGPMCMIVLFANFSQIISPHIRERIWFVQPYATSSVREHKYNTDMTSPQHALTTLVTCNTCVKNSVHTLGHFCKRGGGCHNCQMCKWSINYSMEKNASKGLHNSLTESIFWRSSPNLIINKFCWLIMLFNYDSIMALTICLINFHIIPPATGKNHVLYKKVNPLESLIDIRYQKLYM